MHVAKEKRLPAKIEIGANAIPQTMEMQNGIRQSITDNPLVALLIKYDMMEEKATQATTPPSIPHQTPAFCPMPIPVQIATTGIIKHELHPLIPLAISMPLGLLSLLPSILFTIATSLLCYPFKILPLSFLPIQVHQSRTFGRMIPNLLAVPD